MARRFAKVSEEEIEEAFFYPSDLVSTKTTFPLRAVKSGGYVPRREASRYISTTVHPPPPPPSADSCIVCMTHLMKY